MSRIEVKPARTMAFALACALCLPAVVAGTFSTDARTASPTSARARSVDPAPIEDALRAFTRYWAERSAATIFTTAAEAARARERVHLRQFTNALGKLYSSGDELDHALAGAACVVFEREWDGALPPSQWSAVQWHNYLDRAVLGWVLDYRQSLLATWVAHGTGKVASFIRAAQLTEYDPRAAFAYWRACA